MRVQNQETQKLEKVICNKCGREMEVENGILMEGCFHSDWMFGYFSKRDREKHAFDLCEDCYEKMVEGFTVAPEIITVTELL